MKADLHVHTNISDGSESIDEILIKAKKLEITHLGITNHDTVKGLREAVELGRKFNIKVIPGIEISAYDYRNKRKIHLLAYNFNIDAPNIKEVCESVINDRHNNSLKQLSTLIKNGFRLDIKKVMDKCKEGTGLYKQHIMHEMIDENYTDAIYSPLYYKLFKNGGICAQDIEYVDVFEALKAIKKDGGIAVLAHPGQLNSYDIIPELVSNGLDGIEINHHSHTEEDRELIRKISDVFSLILTGGTDYHGKYAMEEIELGSIVCPEESIKYF